MRRGSAVSALGRRIVTTPFATVAAIAEIADPSGFQPDETDPGRVIAHLVVRKLASLEARRKVSLDDD